MKKLLSICLLMSLAALSACGTALPEHSSSSTGLMSVVYEQPDESEFIYQYDAVLGGVIIKGYTGEAEAIRIPDTLDGDPVLQIRKGEKNDEFEMYTTSNGFRFGSSLNRLKHIYLPDSVTYIDKDLFKSSMLISINIPNGFEKIEEEQFSGCHSLESVDIPDSVTSIGRKAFYGCTSLLSIVIPDNVEKILGYTFQNCTSLTEVTLPKNLEMIDMGAFRDCTSLRSVTIPEGTKKIYNSAFNGCASLTEVVIPDGAEIFDSAFENCTKLKKLDLPDNVIVRNWAFNGCDALTVTYKGNSYNYSNFTELYKLFSDGAYN